MPTKTLPDLAPIDVDSIHFDAFDLSEDPDVRAARERHHRVVTEVKTVEKRIQGLKDRRRELAGEDTMDALLETETIVDKLREEMSAMAALKEKREQAWEALQEAEADAKARIEAKAGPFLDELHAKIVRTVVTLQTQLEALGRTRDGIRRGRYYAKTDNRPAIPKTLQLGTLRHWRDASGDFSGWNQFAKSAKALGIDIDR
jgi:DNA repair exonuclease SbcCD ATPase subunit